MPIDENLINTMNKIYNLTQNAEPDHSDSYYRMKIVVQSLRALAHTLLIAQERSNIIEVDLQKTALGILGTAAWLEEGLSENAT